MIYEVESVGEVLKKEDTVIYESTVYFGITEDECGPIWRRPYFEIKKSLLNNLKEYGTNVMNFDSLANPEKVKHKEDLEMVHKMSSEKYDAMF